MGGYKLIKASYDVTDVIIKSININLIKKVNDEKHYVSSWTKTYIYDSGVNGHKDLDCKLGYDCAIKFDAIVEKNVFDNISVDLRDEEYNVTLINLKSNQRPKTCTGDQIELTFDIQRISNYIIKEITKLIKNY